MFKWRKESLSEVCFEIRAENESVINVDVMKLVRSVVSIYPKALLKVETLLTLNGCRSLIKVVLPSSETTNDFVKVIEAILHSVLPLNTDCVRVECERNLPF